MKTCPYCKKEFIKINVNHLKKHKKTKLEYYKDYYPDKYYLEYISDFFIEYYKPITQQYIEMIYSSYSKSYKWVTINCDKNQEQGRRWGLNKKDLIKHLKNEKTLGVIPEEHRVHFLTFDIDVYNFKIVLSITRALNRLGISNNQILTSFSGNKGYHVTIFFKDAISNEKAKMLFDITLIMGGWFVDNYKGEVGKKEVPIIEHRGITQQGVKLPLSINHKNNGPLDNFCYLCDEYVNKTNALLKIESMKKIETSIIYTIIEENLELLNRYNRMIEQERKSHKTKKTGIKQEKDINKEVNKKILKELKNEDLIIKEGNRHHTILNLAIKNKVKEGYTREQNEEFLKKFCDNQKHSFKTSKEENEHEIKAILRTIYNSKTAYKYEDVIFNEKVKFTKGEILDILSVEKKLRAVYFALIICYKKHGKEHEPVFYMAYSEIEKIAKVKRAEICERLALLEGLNKIKIIQKGKWDTSLKNVKRKLTNQYTIVSEIELDPEKCDYSLKTNRVDGVNKEITYKNFLCMCSKIFTKNEIKKYFGSSQEVIRYKHSKAYDVA